MKILFLFMAFIISSCSETDNNMTKLRVKVNKKLASKSPYRAWDTASPLTAATNIDCLAVFVRYPEFPPDGICTNATQTQAIEVNDIVGFFPVFPGENSFDAFLIAGPSRNIRFVGMQNTQGTFAGCPSVFEINDTVQSSFGRPKVGFATTRDLPPGFVEINGGINDASLGFEIDNCEGPLFDSFGGGSLNKNVVLTPSVLTAGGTTSVAATIEDDLGATLPENGNVTITTHSLADCSDATLEASSTITLTAGSGSDLSFTRNIVGNSGMTYIKGSYPGSVPSCQSFSMSAELASAVITIDIQPGYLGGSFNPLDVQPQISIKDQFNNPIIGQTPTIVSYRNGGTCSAPSATPLGDISNLTDSNGIIVYTSLGIDTGTLACGGGDCNLDFTLSRSTVCSTPF